MISDVTKEFYHCLVVNSNETQKAFSFKKRFMCSPQFKIKSVIYSELI